MTDQEQRTREVALAAFENFKNGLAGDDAALNRFIDDMHPEMVLYFPQGPNLGGAYSDNEKIREFFGYVRKVYNTGLFITVDRVYVDGDTAGFQFHDTATTRDGSEYRGTVFISFQIKDDKLYRYREYFGLRWNEHPAWP